MPCLAKLNNHHPHFNTNPIISPKENIGLFSPLNNNIAKFSTKNTYMLGEV